MTALSTLSPDMPTIGVNMMRSAWSLRVGKEVLLAYGVQHRSCRQLA